MCIRCILSKLIFCITCNLNIIKNLKSLLPLLQDQRHVSHWRSTLNPGTKKFFGDGVTAEVIFDLLSNIICTIFSGCDQHNEGSASSTELSNNSNDRQRYEISR